MRKFTRKPCPEALIERGEKWTAAFIRKGQFSKLKWPEYKTQKLNHVLLATGLRDQTQLHCSYCDFHPIKPPGEENIDHFRPKSIFPELAFDWDNLFYCCTTCNGIKLEKYEQALLKPDEIDYDFDRFFAWNFDTGELLPNKAAAVDAQYRAERTIALLELNKLHPVLRLDERDDFIAKGRTNLDKCCYRDFLERA